VTAGPAADTVDTAVLWDAARRFATGVAVVTAGTARSAHGTTVSAFTFVSRVPALIAICLIRGSSMLELIDERGSFAVNVLANHQSGLARHFADRRRGGAQFAGVPWVPGLRDGVPLLIGAMCWLGCEYEQRVPAGDHELVLGRVAAVTAGDGDPLVYFSGRFYAGLNKELV